MDIDIEDHDVKWHPQHEEILKEWSEICSSYRWLHNTSHRKYKRQNISFTLPVIILSTIAGTANFSQGSLSGNYALYAPVIIGTINLIAGLITTIAEFLKVSELSESHRSSSLSFGKLARNIKVELSLPWSERNSNGKEFLKMCRNEMDRLLEQSASIPYDVVKKYDEKFSSLGLYKPEIMEIHKVNIYRNQKEIQEEHTGNIVANAAKAFKDFSKKHHSVSVNDRMKNVLEQMKSTISSVDNRNYIEMTDIDNKQKDMKKQLIEEIQSNEHIINIDCKED